MADGHMIQIPPMNSHYRLVVWQRSQELTVLVCQLRSVLPPKDEKYVTIPQIRRATWSVQNNIAEGNAKRGRAERRRFLDISLGSLAEVDSMVTTLPKIYLVEQSIVNVIETKRRAITAGIFKLLRSGRE